MTIERLSPTRGIAHPAPIRVTFQHCLTQPAEILFILSFERNLDQEGRTSQNKIEFFKQRLVLRGMALLLVTSRKMPPSCLPGYRRSASFLHCSRQMPMHVAGFLERGWNLRVAGSPEKKVASPALLRAMSGCRYSRRNEWWGGPESFVPRPGRCCTKGFPRRFSSVSSPTLDCMSTFGVWIAPNDNTTSDAAPMRCIQFQNLVAIDSPPSL
jgi:hypothetical protein